MIRTLRFRNKAAFIAVLGLWLGLGLGLYPNPTVDGSGDVAVNAEPAPHPAELSAAEAFPHVVPARSTFFSILQNLGVPPASIHQIVSASRGVYDLRHLKAGTRFQILRSPEPDAQLVGLIIRFSAIEFLEIRQDGQGWKAQKKVEEVETRRATFSGVVTTSLWESAEKAGMDPNLISDLAEIFAWEVDFAREVRQQDRWRLSVEQRFVKGQPIGWGVILAAEYENRGELHQAVLFRRGQENLGYFTPEGTSLRKMFLKSPIRYGRISSRFQKRRFHPILQIHRPHLGVDYAAPIGTPVRAVGDGVVVFAGWSGGGGKVIKLRHNSTYQTAYKHLNGYAPGVRSGSRVRQGQVIGYVGNTGLSTAPHLHFEFFQGGRFVDPLGKKFPSADPVPNALMAEFKANAVPQLQSLPAWDSVAMVTNESDFQRQPAAAN